MQSLTDIFSIFRCNMVSTFALKPGATFIRLSHKCNSEMLANKTSWHTTCMPLNQNNTKSAQNFCQLLRTYDHIYFCCRVSHVKQKKFLYQLVDLLISNSHYPLTYWNDSELHATEFLFENDICSLVVCLYSALMPASLGREVVLFMY